MCKEWYFVIGWGVVVGIVMFLLLVFWGIYKLFKVFGIKLFYNIVYWMKCFDFCSWGFEEEEIDERFRDWLMGSVDIYWEIVFFVLDREEMKIDRC